MSLNLSSSLERFRGNNLSHILKMAIYNYKYYFKDKREGFI